MEFQWLFPKSLLPWEIQTLQENFPTTASILLDLHNLSIENLPLRVVVSRSLKISLKWENTNSGKSIDSSGLEGGSAGSGIQQEVLIWAHCLNNRIEMAKDIWNHWKIDYDLRLTSVSFFTIAKIGSSKLRRGLDRICLHSVTFRLNPDWELAIAKVSFSYVRRYEDDKLPTYWSITMSYNKLHGLAANPRKEFPCKMISWLDIVTLVHPLSSSILQGIMLKITNCDGGCWILEYL